MTEIPVQIEFAPVAAQRLADRFFCSGSHFPSAIDHFLSRLRIPFALDRDLGCGGLDVV